MFVYDTNGILDTCHCGARPGVEYIPGEQPRWVARCSECAETTLRHPSESWATTAWNRRMRVLKQEENK